MKKILCVLSLLFFLSCQQAEKRKGPSVLVTLPPYAYFVKKIAKDSIHVEILVPPGTNPHVYEPNPKQVEDMLDVALWFQIGESIEARVLRVLQEHNPHMLAIDLSKGIPLIEEPEAHNHSHVDEGKDRHIWLSPKLAQIQARTIAGALIAAFPEHTEQFKLGLNELVEELQKLDLEIAKRLEPFKGQAILVSHPAFGYFCQEFQLKQISIECEGKDPLPRHIEHILHESKALGVRDIFTQPQYNNKAAILIGEQLSIPTHNVDPYALDYVPNLLHITQLISHEKK